jgi:hypothetical protein
MIRGFLAIDLLSLSSKVHLKIVFDKTGKLMRMKRQRQIGGKTKKKNEMNDPIFRERTNCMHRNRGNLTVGLKKDTVEIVSIIFPRPLPHTPPQNLRF